MRAFVTLRFVDWTLSVAEGSIIPYLNPEFQINKMHSTLRVLLIALCSLSTLTIMSHTAVDNAATVSPIDDTQTIVVWFKDQYLEKADSYQSKITEFKGKKRSDLRIEMMTALKAMSNSSFAKVASDLNALQVEGQVKNVKPHWIINGFSCTVTSAGFKAIEQLEDVAFVFVKPEPRTSRGKNMGPEYLDTIPVSNFDPTEVESYPWNIKKIRAPEVWNEFGITGKGVLNVVHDSGFKLDVPPLASNLYTNQDEIPGNEVDDDQNGYVDDYHGYHFDEAAANINEPTIRRGTNIHGNLCAAMIVGTFATGSKQAIGIAPDAKWAPVLATSNIEQAIEWAIEQGADTYSMSFSQPNLEEYRTHWRKVMEQGSLCGLVFISGAGNFAAGSNFAPVPVQMRNPEDIPIAVLGVAGVGEEGQRPKFSSQGPVLWNTNYYNEGQVNKPDFTTINAKVPCINPEGRLENMASGNSLAGPHMAGIVSLMLSANPELLPWEVRAILLSTAQDIGTPGFDFQTGHGFVNAYDAVKAVVEK